MDFLSSLPEVFQNETIFFLAIVLGLLFFGLLGAWLFRELRGPTRQRPASKAPSGGGPTDASLSGVYRGSAGATRTMDSSPSGILGSINRPVGRASQTPGTSIISGTSGQGAPLGSQRDREQIEPELRQAGYYRPTALAEYRSVRALLVLFPLLVAAIVAQFVEPAVIPSVAVYGIVLAALGYSIPRVYVNIVARRRRREIERGLPVALDMIVLGMFAGQNVMNSFQRVAIEIRRSYPVLGEEMALAYRQAELNTLGHALRVWADRSGVPEVHNLSVILTQAERQGADVANSLLEFASSYRVTLRQRAETQANRVSFWMLFPTILCMYVPAAVVLAGPICMDFAERRTKARAAIIPAGANPNDPLSKTFQPYLQKNKPPQTQEPGR
jgi:tight adherence protein C